jgi:O-antigen/teichoic acid export membrane protein
MALSNYFRSHLLWKGLSLITSFVTTIVLSRFLEASLTGELFYWIAWLSFLILILSVGMDSALVYYISSGKINSGQLFPFVLRWLLFCLGFMILIEFLLHFTNEVIEIALPFGSCFLYVSGQLMVLFLSALFFGEKNFTIPSMIQAGTNFLYTAFWMFVFRDEMINSSAPALILSYNGLFFIQGLLLICIYLYKYKHLIRGWITLEKNTIRGIFLYSKVALFANVLYLIFNRSDYWLIKIYGITDDELGNYVQASRLVQLFQLLPSILAGVVFPVVASNKQKMMDFIMPMARVLFLFNLISAVFIFMVGDMLFPYILGNTFNLMYHYFLLLIPGILSFSILALISAYFAAIDKVRWNLFTTMIAVLCMLAGNLGFIQIYGVDASAISSSCGALSACLASIILFKKETLFTWKQILMPGENDRHLFKSIFRYKLI